MAPSSKSSPQVVDVPDVPASKKKGKNYAVNPRSAYNIYSMENRDRIVKENEAALKDVPHSKKFTIIVSKIAQEFKKLSPEELKIWKDKAAEDVLRFEADLERGLLSKGGRGTKRSAPGEDAPPPPKSTKVVKANPFLFFTKVNMAKVKAEDPTIKHVELMRKLSGRWKAMSEEEKKVYADMAKEARGEFVKALEEEKMAKFGSAGPAPKKPVTPFFQFCDENRARVVAENPELKNKPGSVSTAKLATIWNGMSLEEKQSYVDKSNEARRLFVIEMDEYVKRRRLADGVDDDEP